MDPLSDDQLRRVMPNLPAAKCQRYLPPGDLAAKLGNTQPGDGQRYKGRGADPDHRAPQLREVRRAAGL